MIEIRLTFFLTLICNFLQICNFPLTFCNFPLKFCNFPRSNRTIYISDSSQSQDWNDCAKNAWTVSKVPLFFYVWNSVYLYIVLLHILQIFLYCIFKFIFKSCSKHIRNWILILTIRLTRNHMSTFKKFGKNSPRSNFKIFEFQNRPREIFPEFPSKPCYY